ncbi:MAG: endo alpha-1,4 polygalactosaminidase, partial [Victivallales bacterium]|nr:endo alpha-1,4 polygalactosaminidase [Victivallales bacterium]
FLLFAAVVEAGPSFMYILQAEKFAKSKEAFVKKINESGRQLVVIDYSFDGSKEGMWRPQEIAAMKKSDSNRRIVAYLSIGEAEDYRPYWKKEWKEKRPGFLVEENKEWKGNFRVRYWRKDWQAIVFSYLETIVNQGFDGVYLDIVDGYEFFEKGKDNCVNPETKRTYRQDMKQFVTEIAKRAKQHSAHFMVIQQNAQALFEDSEYMSQLDGIGAEDVFTNGKRAQKEREISETIGYLKKAQAKGLIVVLVDYPKGAELQEFVCKNATKNGLDVLITNRGLTKLGQFFPAK